MNNTDGKSYTGTTGSAGGCSVKDVEAGTYTVTVTKTGYTDYTSSVTVDKDATVNITLTASS